MKLKFGQLHATTACYYQAFGLVVSQALGGGPSKPKSGVPVKGDYVDLAQAPSFEAALANINAALTM